VTTALLEQARAAAVAFVGGAAQLPGAPSLPLVVRPEMSSGERIADVGALLAAVGLLLGAGFVIRSALPEIRPAVFAAVGLAVLMWSSVNPLFWQLASVTVDAEGVSMTRHSADDLRIAWTDLRQVELDGGKALPYFQDDRALRLVDAQGLQLDIPRYLPEAPALAAAVVAALEGRAGP